MSSPSPGKRRMDTDVMKLIESRHEVNLVGNSLNVFQVKFYGPQGTPYEGGVWRIRVELPDKYPFKSPRKAIQYMNRYYSIGFLNKIYHPNIDFASGSVCLDVINQTWTPLYDLANVFDTFVPQLLMYPNPTDPLNGDAASLFLHKPEDYKSRVHDYVRKYATEQALKNDGYGEDDDASDDESTISDFSCDNGDEMEMEMD